MLKPLEKLVEQAEGDYLAPPQLAELESYHRGFDLRARTYRAIQAVEEELLAEVDLRRVAQNLKELTPAEQAKCTRDTRNVLRHCTLGMLLDDREYLYDHALNWLKTIMVSVDCLEEHRQVYSHLQAVAGLKLKPEQAKLLNEYLLYAQTVMGES